MGIEWIGGAASRWAGSARGDTTDEMGRRTVVRVASLLAMDEREKREGEVYCPRRRTGTESAEPPKIFVVSIVVSCGGREWKRWRTELDFGRSEPFDNHHGASTLRTAPKIFRIIGG
jgi:hypothetical protein